MSNLNDPAMWNVSDFTWCCHIDVIIHLGDYLSPPNRCSHEADLQYLPEYHMFVLFESTHSYINQLEFDNIIGLSAYAGILTADPKVF